MTPRPRNPGSPAWSTTQPMQSVNAANESPALDPADTVLQLLAAALASRLNISHASQDRGPQPMLTVAQTASLLGVSRMTITRMADAGELPCVVITRSGKKKTRRFPRSSIEKLALGKNSGNGLEGHAARSPVQTPAPPNTS